MRERGRGGLACGGGWAGEWEDEASFGLAEAAYVRWGRGLCGSGRGLNVRGVQDECESGVWWGG